MKKLKKRKILFVCTGNTCRSALAAAYLRKLCGERRIKDVEALSAGVSALNGMPASGNAVEVAAEFGMDVSAHLSTMLTPELVRSADLVVAMTESHRRQALRISRHDDERKFKLLLDFSPDGRRGDIADPFGGNLEIYRNCLLQMMPAMDNLLAHLTNKHKVKGT